MAIIEPIMTIGTFQNPLRANRASRAAHSKVEVTSRLAEAEQASEAVWVPQGMLEATWVWVCVEESWAEAVA